MEIPFECFEYTLTTMKEGDGSQSKTTLVCADYDSDETMVDDSIPGSEEEEDELYLKRILINDDVFSTSAVSLCPKKTNVGEQSPEIHFISKLIPAARIETATKQVSNTPSDEEASQSLLRNWEKNSKPIFPLLKESCPCQPTMDHTGLCEDSQQLFDSSEIEETLPEKDLTERSTRSTPSLCNSFGWVPSDSSHLYNVKEQSITQETFQNFNEKSTLTKGDCKNVSRNDTSYSQTSLSLLELVKPASEVSKTAICDIEVRERQRISNNKSTFSVLVLLDWLKEKKPYGREDDDDDCVVQIPTWLSFKFANRAESVTMNKLAQKEQKSTESTTATEIVLRKSSRLEIHRNARSSGKRKKRTDSTNRIGGQEETSNCTAPIQIASIRLNRKEGERTLLEKACTRKEVVTEESTQHSTTSKRFRNIHKRNLMGETLLHKACRKGELELVIALLEAGINVNHEDNAGWRAIHEASCKGNSEIILALIQAGADVNCKGLDGILPLHDAVYCNHFKAAEILMKFGADPYEKDDKMENAFDKCCSDKMMEILTSYCGSVDTPREHVIANQNEPDLRIESNQVSRSNVCRTEEILSTLHDIESKQKQLLSSELEASEDAGSILTRASGAILERLAQDASGSCERNRWLAARPSAKTGQAPGLTAVLPVSILLAILRSSGTRSRRSSTEKVCSDEDWFDSSSDFVMEEDQVLRFSAMVESLVLLQRGR
ncbi:ankyrin repeat domain-containing protein 31 [Eleutherodactylus coqui]|uniref:ankyrin repeat domain-containing protein 31 n=1 Tax=Eleutherodactylus coqui TaxID=57060 RepID=UPI0034633209